MTTTMSPQHVQEAIPAALADVFGEGLELHRALMIPGGASKEAWAVDASLNGQPLPLLVRRAGGGVIYADTLSLEQEYRVVKAAFEAGITVPEPYGYLPDLAGRPAFVMKRIEGESIGRRVVQREDLAAAREGLPERMADELAKIHRLSLETLPFLPGATAAPAAETVIERLYEALDQTEEPHPAIELGLYWLRENIPPSQDLVVLHGDFRIGNLMVTPEGLSGVLDWEFAHIGDPAEDLAWPLVRSWRFGMTDKRLGGLGEVEGYLDHYNILSGRNISLNDLFYWEVMGNVKWAVGALTQARRHLNDEERNVELAVLGRLAAEIEYEIIRLIGGGSHAG